MNEVNTGNRKSICINAIAATGFLFAPVNATATDFSARTVREKLNPDEQILFISGVVEGLAYARYASDGKKADGMQCIYKWFYHTDGTMKKIQSAFDNFKDFVPGAIIAAMVAKECGR